MLQIMGQIHRGHTASARRVKAIAVLERCGQARPDGGHIALSKGEKL
jgi:hypothetical protein